MSSTLYKWPAAAKFGRVVPKSKFYEHTSISVTVREKFVSEVRRITWAYKLADATIHLPGSSAVPEIQVFIIDAKNDDISDVVLTAIDKAIPFPIIFEINSSSLVHVRTRMVASYKQLGGTTPQVSTYFTTGWQSAGVNRVPLPPAIDLSSMYARILTPILPVSTRFGEDLLAVAGRVDQVRKLEREITILEKRLRSEPQLNRKVELRRRLRDHTTALTALTNPATPKAEDSAWKN
ncbi:DUF4391 domain-containing protein [Rhodococcus erythropolis]|uniref:DUF4391 domain-containing protein n=1 Tax=Rhodococcus erythropolis TaxID=1833 RepID=UPI000360F0F7|nr:DUF4391 domain-containing protein [Rhodococcus erythropolis]